MANTSDYTALNGNLSIAVKALGSSVISGLFNNMVLLALLASWHGNKNDVIGLGDPSTASVFAGAQLPAATIKEIGECASYSPLLEGVKQSDGKNMGMRDVSVTISQGTGATFTATVTSGAITGVTVTAGGSGYTGAVPTMKIIDAYGKGAILECVTSGGAVTQVNILSGGYNYSSPTVTAQTGATAGERYTRPVFKWHHRQDTGEIAHDDIERYAEMARNALDFRQKTGALVQNSMKQVLTGQLEYLCNAGWFGNPADQTADKWSQCEGIIQAVDNANTYAGVDRTLAANDYWKAKVDTRSQSFSGAQLIEDAMYRKGLADNGGNLDVLLVGPDLYTKFSAEARAFTQIVDANTDRLKFMGQWGFRGQVMRINNTFIVYDWRCPPGTAIGLDLNSWVIAFKKGMKWKTSELYDQKAVKGGVDSDIFYVDTKWMPMCWAPWRNAKYTNVS